MLCSSSLKLIQSKICKIYLSKVFEPEWEARCIKFSLEENAVQLIVAHSRNSYNYSSSWQSFYCIKICLDKYDWADCSNIGLLSTQGKCKKLLSKENLNTIIYLEMQWRTYCSKQINYRHTCTCLNADKKSVLFFSSFHLHKAIKSFAKFLSKTKLSLKSIKCVIRIYAKNLIHLLDSGYIIEKNNINAPLVSDQLLKKLVHTIRQQLYHKNKKGYWRASRHIKASEAILRTKKVLLEWCSNSSIALSKLDALKVNQAIDRILYIWCVK